MKAKILDFLKRTQKATAALAGAVGVFGAATWLPESYGYYVAIAAVFLTWLLTYVFPYVGKMVEEFPEEWDSFPEADLSEHYDALAEWEKELLTKWDDDEDETPTVLVGEVLDPFPSTVEIPKVNPEDTAGIPVIEGEGAPVDGLTVDDILYRLRGEGQNV